MVREIEISFVEENGSVTVQATEGEKELASGKGTTKEEANQQMMQILTRFMKKPFVLKVIKND